MQDNKCGDKLAAALKGKQIDILINNAGYFYEPVEKIGSLNFEEVRGTNYIRLFCLFCLRCVKYFLEIIEPCACVICLKSVFFNFKFVVM